jgi:tRNA G18 (ribose-2'-O)-methylase SpoU
MPEPAFYVWQCPACRLRFPAEADAALSACPGCGAAPARGTAVTPQETPSLGQRPPDRPLVALLDNLRSIHNVGSIFRAADGAGLAHLYLCGVTATPQHPRLAKAALGAEKRVEWSQHNDGAAAAVALRREGYRLWALETGPEAVSLFQVAPPAHPTVLVIGNEKAGVDPGILAHCDQIVALPMRGHKRSLNAAVAFGVAAYTLQFQSG